METLNEYPKVTRGFLKHIWYDMANRADWKERTKWLKKKYKWIK